LCNAKCLCIASSGRFGFAKETLLGCFIGLEIIGEKFERNLAIKGDIFGKVNLARPLWPVFSKMW
jgi:hypothetical protein